MSKRAITLNGLSTAIVALFFTQVLHEFVHLVSALLLGAKVKAFNLFAVDIVLFNSSENLYKDIIIEAGASITNIIVGVIAIALFHNFKTVSSMTKQFFLQLGGYSFLMGFGYFVFDGLFYSPDVPGDWKTVIKMLDGSISLRLALIIIGAVGMVFTFFWLAKNVLIFAADKDDQKSRKEAALPMLLVPYIVLGVLYVLLSAGHPLGFPNGMVIVFFQFIFGFSGLFWGYMLGVHWLKPISKEIDTIKLNSKVSLPWLGIASLLLLFQCFILLPTVTL